MSEDSNQNRNKSLELALRKIESVFNKQDVNQIAIQREYLPEIFDSDLLEISKSDGVPTINCLFFASFYLKKKSLIIIKEYIFILTKV